MRAYVLAWGLAAAFACDGGTIESEASGGAEAAGGSAHDARSETGSGGTGGAIRLDASRDAWAIDVDFPGCAPEATLSIESEDGGQWCSIPLPEFADGGSRFINLRIEKNEGGIRDLGWVGSADECIPDGAYPWAWYYYEVAGAGRIGFCPAACAVIASEGSGKVKVMRGCVNPFLPD
jgi:hypothetical protein